MLRYLYFNRFGIILSRLLCHSLPRCVTQLLLSIQVEIEAAAVRHVAHQSLLLDIELERVVLTPSGVLLGCWQVLSLLFLFSTSNCLTTKSLVSFPSVLLPLNLFEIYLRFVAMN